MKFEKGNYGLCILGVEDLVFEALFKDETVVETVVEIEMSKEDFRVILKELAAKDKACSPLYLTKGTISLTLEVFGITAKISCPRK